MKTVPVLALVTLLTSMGTAAADERPLIWQPARNSENSYTTRIGARIPTVFAPAAGVELGVVTSEGGALVDTPMAAWSDVKLRERHRAGSTVSRTAGARFDPRHGNASLTLNYYEKYIATPLIDIERRSGYSVRYDGATAEWQGVEASQSLRVSQVRSRTSAFAKASAVDGLLSISVNVGLEQKLGQHFSFTASARERLDTDDRSATIRANYSFRW